MNSQVHEKSTARGVAVAQTDAVRVTVSVCFVGGGGNASGGNYHYTCTPEVVHVTRPDTIIKYELTTQTGPEFQFTGVYTSDSLYKPQLKQVTKIGKMGERYVELCHKNKIPMLISVALQVTDIEEGALMSIDPQVTNDPDPSVGGHG
jgi:hypothetical protein